MGKLARFFSTDELLAFNKTFYFREGLSGHYVSVKFWAEMGQGSWLRMLASAMLPRGFRTASAKIR